MLKLLMDRDQPGPIRHIKLMCGRQIFHVWANWNYQTYPIEKAKNIPVWTSQNHQYILNDLQKINVTVGSFTYS